ncbi:MAG TPA: right-handed parallel beta-helix repeat-containing protein, partial [Armatimonadota bacterium]|nr:right-handed parallel beta-helix repeat-containing protein [Armatimonadota bacterium]
MAAYADAPAADFHVATNGNDGWSGTRAEPDAAGADGPFATIARAQQAVRETGRRPLTVLVRGGVYRLREALVFTADDSGTPDAPVTYAAWPGETPVISGGVPVTGWEQGPGELWQAKITAVAQGTRYFRQLFVNGQRRTRARHPNDGYLRTAGPMPSVENPHDGRGDKDPKYREGFQYNPGDIERWDNFEDVTVYLYHSWTCSLHHIRELDEQGHIAYLQPQSGWPVGWWERQQRYQLDNFFEALDEPGEWYLDRKTGVLYYWPMPGEDMTEAEVIAPDVTGDLVTFRGDAEQGRYAEHITLRGLSFQHADWETDPELKTDAQSAAWARGAITTEWARSVSIEECEVAHVGLYGIWLGPRSVECAVRRCHIHDLGAGGVKLGETGRPPNADWPDGGHVVDNCFIHDGGHVFRAGCGVLLLRSSNNQVTHNDICDFYYTGVSAGWSWGYAETTANHNAIEYNHIHDIGKAVLSDMGGIYTLGISPGTTLRHNHIHHVYSYSYGGWGLYTDEGSSDILLENNVVHDTKTGGFHQHYGKGNIVRNNIFAYSMTSQIIRSREEEHSFDFTGNIVTNDNGYLLDGQWANGDYTIDGNLYWDTSGLWPWFDGLSLEEWQALGRDAGSVLRDPRFMDPEARDFRLREDSPALAMGFAPIELSEVGLYGDARWVSLPGTVHREPVQVPPVTLPLRPGPLVDGFEETPVGEHPERATVSGEEQGASIRVSDELAREGRHSLKITDVPSLSRVWQPHMFYRPGFRKGLARVSFDARLAEGAILWHEWRDNASPYQVGPTIKLIAGG